MTHIAKSAAKRKKAMNITAAKNAATTTATIAPAKNAATNSITIAAKSAAARIAFVKIVYKLYLKSRLFLLFLLSF